MFGGSILLGVFFGHSLSKICKRIGNSCPPRRGSPVPFYHFFSLCFLRIGQLAIRFIEYGTTYRFANMITPFFYSSRFTLFSAFNLA